MTQIEDQFAEWALARATLRQIFERARALNIKEQCWRIFDLNLLVIHPLIPEYTAFASPDVAANIVAIINSEIPVVGHKIITQILATASTYLRAGKLDQHTALITAHLFNLGAIDAYPLFQVLVYLKKQAQWRLLGSILAVSGTLLARASKQTYEYIQENAGSHNTCESLDIVLDEHKTRHEYDLSALDRVPVVFKPDPNWPVKAKEYGHMKVEIIGEESESGSDSESESESESENTGETSSGDKKTVSDQLHPAQQPPVIDTTNRKEVALKKTIYLTIMSSLSTQEACHKLLALGNRDMVASMLYETCKQQKIYNKSFGSIGYYLCRASKDWPQSFRAEFLNVYNSLETASTPEIRNMGTLSGYLLASDSMGWEVFSDIYIDPDHSTPSNRIFLQSLFEELRREIGLKEISKRLLGLPAQGILPLKGDTKALMFSINFFTAIKMGPLTDEMRTELKQRQGQA